MPTIQSIIKAVRTLEKVVCAHLQNNTQGNWKFMVLASLNCLHKDLLEGQGNIDVHQILTQGEKFEANSILECLEPIFEMVWENLVDANEEWDYEGVVLAHFRSVIADLTESGVYNEVWNFNPGGPLTPLPARQSDNVQPSSSSSSSSSAAAARSSAWCSCRASRWSRACAKSRRKCSQMASTASREPRAPQSIARRSG